MLWTTLKLYLTLNQRGPQTNPKKQIKVTRNFEKAQVNASMLEQTFLLGIGLGILASLIRRGFLWFSILTPFSVQCIVPSDPEYNIQILCTSPSQGITLLTAHLQDEELQFKSTAVKFVSQFVTSKL